MASLTESHRRAQLALRAATLQDLLKLWPAYRLEDIKGTWPAFETAAVLLTKTRGATSSGLATRYYAEHRASLGIEGAATPRIGTVPDEQIATGLRVVGAVQPGVQLARGRALRDVRQAAFVNVSGALSMYMLNFGRNALLGSIKADPRALGWQRVTSGSPCDFCSMLADRGAVYSEDTADFESHRHCACHAEPLYQ